jgi:hypothetical protein
MVVVPKTGVTSERTPQEAQRLVVSALGGGSSTIVEGIHEGRGGGQLCVLSVAHGASRIFKAPRVGDSSDATFPSWPPPPPSWAVRGDDSGTRWMAATGSSPPSSRTAASTSLANAPHPPP